MGQGDVLEFLKKQKKPIKKTEVEKALKKSHSSIIRSLKLLHKQGYIGTFHLSKGNSYYYYYTGNKMKTGFAQ